MRTIREAESVPVRAIGRSSAKCETVNGRQQFCSQQLMDENCGSEEPCSCMPLRMQQAWDGGAANASAAGARTLTSSNTSKSLAVNGRMQPQAPHLIHRA